MRKTNENKQSKSKDCSGKGSCGTKNSKNSK